MSETAMSEATRNYLMPGQFYGDVLERRRSAGFALSELRHATGRRLPRHTHELAYFCLLLGGDYSEQLGRQRVTYHPFTVMFHPPSTTHRDEVGSRGGRFFNVEIEPGLVERLRECGARVPEAFADVRGGELSWLAARLYREYRARDAASPLAVEGLVLEMLAEAARPRVSVEKRPPAWLARAVELLEAEFRSSLTVADIASRVGVHPFHLSKVFRQFRRETVGDYVQRLRVQHACRLLSETETPLASVALEAGFSDQSHLTRVFRRLTGMTPGRLRSALNSRPS
ncbi:MAG TPA: AraC family transcriptional regulator [Pyrinomonadaceae bacterium]|nr:AraC family transcriptional regulator [Pyrinomonadaceae bacterium]